MIPHRNLEIYASVLFFLVTKILCSLVNWYHGMYSRRKTLSSIPERNESEEDLTTKWVPKKKHEVLKAKYKCLKKLFQIYDASVIGILPEAYGADGYLDEEIQSKRRKKKRSHRTKTDACAMTTELTSDVTQQSISDVTEKGSIANAVITDLNMVQQSCISTQIDNDLTKIPKIEVARNSNVNFHDCSVRQDCEGTQTYETHPVPYLVLNEKRRLTKFQCFIQRILGIRNESENYAMPNGHLYASSDNNIGHNYNYNCSDKRRRRGLRFRRLKRPKKIQSESAIRDMDTPNVLTYMQSVQRDCLMDTTQRQCPMPGCQMVTSGIINYNDHLVLCHFPERKYICHYCHEGFVKEFDKLVHENEHIGITQLGSNVIPLSRQSSRRTARIIQTDSDIPKCNVSVDKLKKIVSFFEKINDPDRILTEIKKNRYSDPNLHDSKIEMPEGGGYTTDSTDKQSVSCVNLNKRIDKKYSVDSRMTLSRPQNAVTCHLCGECFNYRRQLNLHLDFDHADDKYVQYQHNAGMHAKSSNNVGMVSEDGKINVQSIGRSSMMGRTNTCSTHTSYTEITRGKSEESLNYDPSSNIVYYTSMESVENPSNPGQNARGCNSYKWEPGTKIIHV